MTSEEVAQLKPGTIFWGDAGVSFDKNTTLAVWEVTHVNQAMNQYDCAYIGRALVDRAKGHIDLLNFVCAAPRHAYYKLALSFLSQTPTLQLCPEHIALAIQYSK